MTEIARVYNVEVYSKYICDKYTDQQINCRRASVEQEDRALTPGWVQK